MGYIPVELDKTRNILLGFGALKLFKELHGESLMKIDFEKEDPEDILPLIVYVGLKHEDSELTQEKTIELIDKHLGIKGALELLPRIFKELNMDEESKNEMKAAGKK